MPLIVVTITFSKLFYSKTVNFIKFEVYIKKKTLIFHNIHEVTVAVVFIPPQPPLNIHKFQLAAYSSFLQRKVYEFCKFYSNIIIGYRDFS